jgi:hypothetical protein
MKHASGRTPRRVGKDADSLMGKRCQYNEKVSKEKQKQPTNAPRQTVHQILTNHTVKLHHWGSTAAVFQIKEAEIIINSPVENASAKL